MGITAMHGLGLAAGLAVGGVAGHSWQQGRETAAAPRIAENVLAQQRSQPWVDAYNAYRSTLTDETYASRAAKTEQYVREHPVPADASIGFNQAGDAYVQTKSLYRTSGKEQYDLDSTAPLGNDSFGPFFPAAMGVVLGGLAVAGTISGGAPRAAMLGASLLFGAGVGIIGGTVRANVPHNGV